MSVSDDIMDFWLEETNQPVFNRVCFANGDTDDECQVWIGYEDGKGEVEEYLYCLIDWSDEESVSTFWHIHFPNVHQYVRA